MIMLQATFFSLPVVWHNALVTLLTFVYVFSVPPLMDYLVTNNGLPRDISRKITHICAGSVIVFLPLFVDGHWSQYLNITVFAVWTLLLVQKGLFAAEDDQAVKTMTRTGDKRELLKGTLYFVVVAMICGSIYYKQFEGVLAMAVLGWGDGLAPIVGTRYGKIKYNILSQKSVEGSLAFFVGSALAGLFFVHLIVPEAFNVTRILLIALIATVVEGISPKEVDNISIPIAVIGAAQLL
ncbi:diacylglycerol/polyprenol kinase family protein [Chlorobium phaeobacteroides]|jgi:dolichol kinase|uniref:Phosphatidate cytidylyltransferase n=1 Tax=Chlorobium phaeobacteroides (strain DSM 266 / SMG 266 / 2430) TaxID=290317 RepID=A1BIX0_CHLPD|nr:phosphatidate cytidylyltransferase [Chlorobium phaeobacteroides]ABL66347.1 phosphatidate cytidylyltransferase [Chlorobium phaeobacteroides DSM 266]MBV5319744.1 phosphatidate cytidylyltransferase [Chlorobium phaeobacteroides]